MWVNSEDAISLNIINPLKNYKCRNVGNMPCSYTGEQLKTAHVMIDQIYFDFDLKEDLKQVKRNIERMEITIELIKQDQKYMSYN